MIKNNEKYKKCSIKKKRLKSKSIFKLPTFQKIATNDKINQKWHTKNNQIYHKIIKIDQKQIYIYLCKNNY